jgi:transketolase
MVTVEDHQINGGLGGAVAELLSEKMPIPLLRLGIKDRFGESGSPMQLYRKHGIDSESIAKSVKRFYENI